MDQISIIIPTLNGESTIEKMLISLATIVDGIKKEIIIIDSGSIDQTLNIVKKFTSKIIKIQSQDFNHGRTRSIGVKEASSKYIYFTSQDVIINSQDIFKNSLLTIKSNPKNVVVFGQNIPFIDSPIFEIIDISAIYESLNSYTKNNILVQNKYNIQDEFLWYFLSNTNAFYRKDYLLTNPFTTIEYGEDLLMGKVIIDSGFNKIYDSRNIIFHSHKYKSLSEYIIRLQNDYRIKNKILSRPIRSNIKTKLRLIVFDGELTKMKKLKILSNLIIRYCIKILVYIHMLICKSL